MLPCFAKKSTEQTIPINILLQTNFPTWLEVQNGFIKQWIESTHFTGDCGAPLLIPHITGKLAQVIILVNDLNQFWSVGTLAFNLPPGNYQLNVTDERFYIAWGLGAYQFTRYKKSIKKPAQLILPTEHAEIINIVESIYLVRDLINTPAEDMGPEQLAAATANLAKEYKGSVKQIIGEDLLKENYPSIYTVGKASHNAPRLIDMRWGDKSHPKITLVGKGVCFDSGGLDIKNCSGMILMKKDMGGAAHVLGLARMLMEANCPIQLRVLIPAVENVISGNAYKPGDVITSRKGLTIEVGNTDAEGRIVLADALAEAVNDSSEILIDIATLTGAARIALGTELPALFSNDDAVANDIIKTAEEVADPVWRLPLFALYRDAINSTIADLNNNTSDSYAGAITAALFLKEFISEQTTWVHFDLMAWNLKTRPGRPQGGEAMAIRALFQYLKMRYKK